MRCRPPAPPPESDRGDGDADRRTGVEFAISTDFSGQTAVISVRGELDLHAVPQLGALFDLVVAGDFTSVVLDLSAGRHAVQRVPGGDGRRRRAPGCSGPAFCRALTLRPGPTSARRQRVEGHDLRRRAESADLPGAATGSSHRKPSPGGHAGLQVGSAFPSEDDVVDGALRMVVALTRATMDAADGVSVSLRRNGRLSTVAASDQVILDMDTYQYATGEGPCIDASVEGRRFQTQSLADETRWPAFTPKAHSLGISAILSTP